MEWRKVKNIIILLLLLVNVFLLALVWARKSEADSYDRAAFTQAVEALRDRGIQVEQSALSGAEGLSPVDVERDVAGEEALSAALLGEAVAGDNRGGGLYLYRTGAGEVSIRPGGELSAKLNDAPRWRTDDPASHAAALMREMGVEGERTVAPLEDGGTAVTFVQTWEGTPLFSCSAVFTYRQGRLQTVRGALLISSVSAKESGTVLTLPTALMRFLDGIRERGDVCSALQSMAAGYRSGQAASGVTRLTPCWHIVTNTAEYYLDAATGALERIAEG